MKRSVTPVLMGESNQNSEGVARPQAGGERSVTPAEVGSSKSPEWAADWRMTGLSTVGYVRICS